MSRCFPFPPPGYVKSAEAEEVVVPEKEKSKEKKHKKEKKDKERKDKEKSSDKHREKKDRKEKRRDKKEKDKNKDLSNSSDGRKSENKFEDYNREKNDVANLEDEHSNKKVLDELDRRIKDEHGAGNRVGSGAIDQRRINDEHGAGNRIGSGAVDQRRISDEHGAGNRIGSGTVDQRRISDEHGAGNRIGSGAMDQRRIKDEHGPGNRIGSGAMDQRRIKDEHGAGNRIGSGAMDQRRIKDEQGAGNRIGSGGMDQKKIKDEHGAGNRTGSGTMDQGIILSRPSVEKVRTGGDDKKHEKYMQGLNYVGNERNPVDNRKQEGMLGLSKMDVEKGADITETNKEKRDKSKDKEKEKKRRDKDRGKDEKKEKEKLIVKVKEKADLKQNEQYQRGVHIMEGSGVLTNTQKPSFLNDGKLGCLGEDTMKRKVLEMNGFARESGNWPNKLPKTAASSHPPLENGRKSELLCMPNPFGHDRQGSSDNKSLIDRKKDDKVNGKVEAGRSLVSLITPAGGKSNESGEASAPRSPHPDEKYLNQIYAIPKVEDWYSHDDTQDWLFSRGDANGRVQNHKVNSEDLVSAPQVWDEALLLPAVDIYALPYVIPR